MKTITQEKLKKILIKHKIWLEDPNNEESERADLREADLREADLREADLQGADLQGANLRRADLQGADLLGADLRRADLQGADLQGANLLGANLQGANLQGANLQGADLLGADLREADLREADLREADLQGADLLGANLRRADLQGANLRRADYGSIQCPEEGAFIAFKKCRDDKIVKLLIPEDAKRSSATSRKCRANKASILEISSLDGKIKYKEAQSTYDNNFVYKQGETIEIENFDNDRWNECAPGIHFFITRQEAIDY